MTSQRTVRPGGGERADEDAVKARGAGAGAQAGAAAGGDGDGRRAPLVREMEREVIELFVAGARLVGQPRSIGEIYGFLYLCPHPVTMADIVEHLNLSKGSASQGLRLLRNLGAVRLTYVPGDRRDHYYAETRLKHIVAGFIKEELRPHLDSGASRIRSIETLLEKRRSDFLPTKSANPTPRNDRTKPGGDGAQPLATLRGDGSDGPAQPLEKFYLDRAAKLRQWLKRAHQLLPLAQKILGS